MSPLEQRVTQALGKAQPGAAVDFGVIMQIMSLVLEFIQQCPFGNAKRAIREGGLEAKVAAYRAVQSSGYDVNSVDLANALIYQGRQASDDELESTIASAHALPSLRVPFCAVMLACLISTAAAVAGPFPGHTSRAPGGGPFPVSSTGGDREYALHGEPVTSEFTPDASRAADSRSPALPGSSLREQIAAYRAAGGGTIGVRGMTITTHMLRDHGWSPKQLSGLSADELYLLHGMQHAGRIRPNEVSRRTEDATAADAESYPVTQIGATAYWRVNGVQWSNLGGGVPVEGQIYNGGGQSFAYRNGRMHAVRGAASARCCPGGRCRIR